MSDMALPQRDGSSDAARALKSAVEERVEALVVEAEAAGWLRGSVYRILQERLRAIATDNMLGETHHTLGGDVMRIGATKAPRSTRLIDRVRDFLAAW